jgi:hypothetical protein
MFPWSLERELRLDDPGNVGQAALVDSLVQELRKVKAKFVQAREGRLSFMGGGGGSNPLVTVNCGIVSVEERYGFLAVHYKLGFDQTLLIGFVLSVCVGLVACLTGPNQVVLVGRGITAFLIALAVCCVNILNAVICFRGMLRRAWRNARQRVTLR